MASTLTAEIAKFLHWSEQFPEDGRAPGWEAGYAEWPTLRDAALALVKSAEPAAAGTQSVEQVLYVVARDNTEQWLVQYLIDYPKWLHAVAKASLEFDDGDARWQLAVALGASSNKAEAEQLLLKFNADADEYVSRMALLALANIGSAQTEQLAVKAWKTNDEYQRIAALWAVWRIKSGNLHKFIEAAKKDGRAHLLHNVAKVTQPA
ncbi:MAG: HEAT repeat domain-containing protein [Burkholderiales bacterium]